MTTNSTHESAILLRRAVQRLPGLGGLVERLSSSLGEAVVVVVFCCEANGDEGRRRQGKKKHGAFDWGWGR